MYDISFIKRFETTVKKHWNDAALNDYKHPVSTYGQLAAQIEADHLLWKAAGIEKGAKIALNAKSCAGWIKTFMGVMTGGYVGVQLFDGYTPADTMSLVNHSDSVLLYTERRLMDKMDFEQMPVLKGAIDVHTGELLASRGDFAQIYNNRESIMKDAHPGGFNAQDFKGYEDRPADELCGLNYTSGSTGNPKGVMLTVRNFSANVFLIPRHFPYREGQTYLSVLPFAHIFGMMYDAIEPLCLGMHLTILGMPPIPAYLKPALAEVKPNVFFAVPLILVKMLDNTIGEFVSSKSGKQKLADHHNNQDYCKALRTIFMSAFGDNIELLVTGGAAMAFDLEDLMAQKLEIPFVTGYGMTEACPTISIGEKGKYKMKSVGEIVPEGIECRIDSSDPEHIPGEVIIKGDCVFTGYYKNPEATAEVLDKDGWFRTGDMGTIDKDNTVFLAGRCKNMLLSANGQNIFPEEIEVVLNALPYVAESIIVDRKGHLTALIVPNVDQVAASGMDNDALNAVMAGNITKLNQEIPAYSHVDGFELKFEPFVKTPKGSIRRFMYK
ncbi:MAG: AMP-binding protein [Bacteroidaceae bacterium]|nr:AMP-binding protein [Bacteroidaceae bacterium]